MMEALIVSNVVLWVVAIALGVTLAALARQVGLLHERSAPLGAMMADSGPEVGEQAPEFQLEDLTGKSVQIGGADEEGRDSLLVFLSPSCPMCNKLLPVIQSLGRKEGLKVVVVSDGEEAEHKRFLERHDMEDIPYVVSAEIGMQYQVGRVPHAVLVDDRGVIRAKGLVNTREHLESLIEAKEQDLPSLQDYLEQGHDHSHHHEAREKDDAAQPIH